MDGSESGIKSRDLNKMFIERADKMDRPIDQISSVFIADRLERDGRRPRVTCEFRREADVSKWRFLIERKNEEPRVVAVELTDQYLMGSAMPVTYELERAVKIELGILPRPQPAK